MATKLNDVIEGYGPHTLYALKALTDIDSVNVEVWREDDPITATIAKADFIAAVETELNGIFISRDDLPTEFSGCSARVTVLNGGKDAFEFNPEYDTYESLRQSALNLLAAAEYVKKNPPVLIDQKQVDTLAVILGGRVSPWDAQHVAREILASGKVTVTVND